LAFMQLTDALKKALPDRLGELVTLAVTSATGNEYERNQDERLCDLRESVHGHDLRSVRAVGHLRSGAISRWNPLPQGGLRPRAAT
jgi:hypothetical protein